MKKMLILLGGMWHDFDGFAGAVRPVFENAGWLVDATYDFDRVLALESDGIDLVVSYTCFTKHREGENDNGPEQLGDAQVRALAAWVREGGPLLGLHAATVLGDSDPELGRLLGGVFIEHPPAFSFTVYPLSKPHLIISGIDAFSVHDEFYVQELTTPVDLHMVALDRGVAHLMVWSKAEGKGKVAYIAMGHSPEVWSLASYQRLLLQAVSWLES
jgi:type 1 glutamine amidotransferase